MIPPVFLPSGAVDKCTVECHFLVLVKGCPQARELLYYSLSLDAEEHTVKWLYEAIFTEKTVRSYLVFKLISRTNSDGVPPGKGRPPIIPFHIKLFSQRLLVSLLVFSTVFAGPVTASAGFFSLVAGKLFEKEARAAEVEAPVNSQTMSLLEAVSNPDPKAGKGVDITIVAGSALEASAGPLGTAADIDDSAPKSDQISVYVVREGDTLSGIADMFGVSVNTIVWANDLPGKTVSVGATLVILPVTGVKYTVKAGDTLATIAKKFKGDADDIAGFNGFVPNHTLAAGEEIIIPDGEIQTVVTPKTIVKGSSKGVVQSLVGFFLRPVVRATVTQGIHGHNGVDLGANLGEPILASAAGTVIISRAGGYNGGYGTYVVIAHSNGTQTLYAHNSSNVVSVGERVTRGQVIGYVGNTGKSTGPHLHFEVRGAKNPFYR